MRGSEARREIVAQKISKNQIRRKRTLFTGIFENPSLYFMETIETKIFIILRHSYLFEMKTNFSWRAVGRFAGGSTKQTSNEMPHGPWIRHPSARPEIRPLLPPRRDLFQDLNIWKTRRHSLYTSGFIFFVSLCPRHLFSGNLTFIIKPRVNGDPVSRICTLTAFPRTGRLVDAQTTSAPSIADNAV